MKVRYAGVQGSVRGAPLSQRHASPHRYMSCSPCALYAHSGTKGRSGGNSPCLQGSRLVVSEHRQTNSGNPTAGWNDPQCNHFPKIAPYRDFKNSPVTAKLRRLLDSGQGEPQACKSPGKWHFCLIKATKRLTMDMKGCWSLLIFLVSLKTVCP